MKGIVDEFGRALLTLQIDGNGNSQELTAWVDTAFNGELVIPGRLIESIGLQQSAGIEAKLADGNIVMLESYSCEIQWMGETRSIEVVANDGDFPLIGVGLLLGHSLTVDYRQMFVSLG